MSLSANMSKMQQLTRIIVEKYNKQRESLNLRCLCQEWEKIVLLGSANQNYPKVVWDWAKLKSLWILECAITDKNIGIMAQIKWNNLQNLSLSYNQFGNKGIKIFIKIFFPKLKSLYINRCLITDEGIKNMAKGYWPNLNQLLIPQNSINQSGYEALITGNWKNLKEIFCDGGSIGMLSLNLLQSSAAKISYKFDSHKKIKIDVDRIKFIKRK